MIKVYARDTTTELIDRTTADAFVSSHHTQGSVSAECWSIGLITANDELVAQFCEPRTASKCRQYTTEWVRLAFKQGVRVTGGASKLLKHYIDLFHPTDVFTYQDTTGENTALYEHCGMTLVHQALHKEYLIAPSKTLETATRWQCLSLAYATRFGPDRILGTRLGEVLDDETGVRKSNQRIFIEDLGWHIERTSGDKVYEWVDKDVTFYTYRITASDSPKYYYGTSRVRWANATKEECAADGYLGSGGPKFQNWRDLHGQNINKEVLETFTRKVDAYEAEQALVGKLQQTDPDCLNSTDGGVGSRRSGAYAVFSVQECGIHGEVSHQGLYCKACLSLSSIAVSCTVTHGDVLHRLGRCLTCASRASVSTRACPTHGQTRFQGDTCMRCSAALSLRILNCPTHGDVLHTGTSCRSCTSAASTTIQDCTVHGMVMHRGDSCMTCTAQQSYSYRECLIHGESVHKGAACRTCVAESSLSLRHCAIHGQGKHSGGTCVSCTVTSPYLLDECSVHGVTMFQGSHCAACKSAKVFVTRSCDVHGEGYHIGNSCMRCTVASSISAGTCDYHGYGTFVWGRCARCTALSTYSLKTCALHGETKHRGSSCARCTALKTAHSRFHKTEVRPECTLCVGGLT